MKKALIFTCIMSLLLSTSHGVKQAPPLLESATLQRLSEQEKIDQLIFTVRNLKDARFIRNGKDYSSKDAANHLEGKKIRRKDEYTTAREFIVVGATKSSSGQYYMIRYKDGKEIKLSDFLKNKLDRIEKK